MSFKDGEKVTGIPYGEEMKKAFPKGVTGFYQSHSFEFLGNVNQVEFVYANGVSVDCYDLRKATRRDKESVLHD